MTDDDETRWGSKTMVREFRKLHEKVEENRDDLTVVREGKIVMKYLKIFAGIFTTVAGVLLTLKALGVIDL